MCIMLQRNTFFFLKSEVKKNMAWWALIQHENKHAQKQAKSTIKQLLHNQSWVTIDPNVWLIVSCIFVCTMLTFEWMCDMQE